VPRFCGFPRKFVTIGITPAAFMPKVRARVDPVAESTTRNPPKSSARTAAAGLGLAIGVAVGDGLAVWGGFPALTMPLPRTGVATIAQAESKRSGTEQCMVDVFNEFLSYTLRFS
jgi:hypothetical protein